MSNDNIKGEFEQDLEKLEGDEVLSDSFKKKKLFAYAVRTSIMIAIYVYFWDYVWLRWTLLLYVPLNLFGLGFIFAAPYMLEKKMDELRQKMDAMEE